MDLRKEVYVRSNMTPVFISERTPGPSRENLYEMLESVGMEYLNRLEWLIRTNLKYSGDNFYVIRYEDKKDVSINFNQNGMNLHSLIRNILVLICSGVNVNIDGFIISDKNKKDIYRILIKLYSKSFDFRRNSLEKSISNRGRNRKVSDNENDNIFKEYLNKKITVEDALSLLNVSRSTFFRELKKIKTDKLP